MRLLWSSLIVSGLLLGPGTLVLADPAVKRITAGEAQGLRGPVPDLWVWPGSSTNLSFIETGEIIRSVWLDDPKAFLMSFDGPMCVGSPQASQGCPNAAATVIRLQTQAPSKSTLLTVVTTGPSGRQLYQFRLRSATRKPTYNTVSVLPGQPEVQSSAPVVNPESILKGLAIAQQKGLVQKDGATWQKVQQAVNLIKNSQSPEQAAATAGLPAHILQKLAQIGAGAVLPSPMPQAQPIKIPSRPQVAASPPPVKPKPVGPKPSPQAQATQAQVTQAQITSVPARPRTVADPTPKPQASPTATPAATAPQPSPKPPQPPRGGAQASSVVAQAPSPKPQTADVTPVATPVTPNQSLRDPNEATVLEKPVSGVQQATALVRGLGIARNKGQIGYQSPMWNKVQNVIKRLRLGDTRKDAAQKAKVDLKIIDQLLKWGGVDAAPPEANSEN